MANTSTPIKYRFALVDIETTGGRPTFDCITEIAVIIVDENGELLRWETLVRPDAYIPVYIQQLTGITNEMVADSPKFKDIAEELYDLLDGCIFVAHNARFDYGFIKNHFSRLGINFQSKVLCSVRLSRKLFPQYKSHSMDRLIENHDLKPISRHRAMGDADLIHQFLRVCFAQFGQEAVIALAKQLLKQSAIPSQLETNINDIPDTPGVYLFFNETDSLPIYIGKSIKLRTRIKSHFTSDHTSTREMNISKQIKHIEYIETAGELGALLLESKLIKEKLPIYNRQLRKNKLTCGLFKELGTDGYLRVNILPLDQEDASYYSSENIFGPFKSKKNAVDNLEELISEYKLCPKLCGLDKSKNSCFGYQLKNCNGACLKLENVAVYNLRVEMALSKYKNVSWPYSGVIGVKEYCKENEMEDIHLFDNWQHVGTASNPSELDDVLHKMNTYTQHNWDEVKIIQKFLMTKIKKNQVIMIKKKSLVTHEHS